MCLLPDDFPPTRGAARAAWWRQVFGASWRRPEGPYSSVENQMNRPVVHVSWNDATAYGVWAGKRLLTEAEWEFAARGGLEHSGYEWDDELTPDGEWRRNIWQGTLPLRNTTLEDSYLGTTPVDEVESNGYGLYNVGGNVWEWCSDLFHSSPSSGSPLWWRNSDLIGTRSPKSSVASGGYGG